MRTPLIIAAFVAVAAVAVSRWRRGYRDEHQRDVGDLSEGTGNIHYIIQRSSVDYDGPDDAA